jgi:hypothetical protein
MSFTYKPLVLSVVMLNVVVLRVMVHVQLTMHNYEHFMTKLPLILASTSTVTKLLKMKRHIETFSNCFFNIFLPIFGASFQV